jgi:hypothetical protein
MYCTRSMWRFDVVLDVTSFACTWLGRYISPNDTAWIINDCSMTRMLFCRRLEWPRVSLSSRLTWGIPYISILYKFVSHMGRWIAVHCSWPFVSSSRSLFHICASMEKQSNPFLWIAFVEIQNVPWAREVTRARGVLTVEGRADIRLHGASDSWSVDSITRRALNWYRNKRYQ